MGIPVYLEKSKADLLSPANLKSVWYFQLSVRTLVLMCFMEIVKLSK